MAGPHSLLSSDLSSGLAAAVRTARNKSGFLSRQKRKGWV